MMDILCKEKVRKGQPPYQHVVFINFFHDSTIFQECQLSLYLIETVVFGKKKYKDANQIFISIYFPLMIFLKTKKDLEVKLYKFLDRLPDEVIQ